MIIKLIKDKQRRWKHYQGLEFYKNLDIIKKQLKF